MALIGTLGRKNWPHVSHKIRRALQAKVGGGILLRRVSLGRYDFMMEDDLGV